MAEFARKKDIVIVKFILFSIIINMLLYYSITPDGYMNIYNHILKNSYAVFYDDTNSYEQLSKLHENNVNKLIYVTDGIEKSERCSNADKFNLIKLKYLKSTENIKYVTVDVGFAQMKCMTYGINGAISDSPHLNNIINAVDELNKMQTEQNKIEIIGILPDTNVDFVIDYVTYLIEKSILEGRVPSQKITPFINYSKKDKKMYIKILAESIAKSEQAYRGFLNENYFDFKMSINNYTPYMYSDDVINANTAKLFLNIFNYNIRSKYFLLNDDMGFLQILSAKYHNIYNKINTQKIYFSYSKNANYQESSFPVKISDDEIIILNNKILRYFEKYRQFVFKINGEKCETYSSDSDYILVINESS